MDRRGITPDIPSSTPAPAGSAASVQPSGPALGGDSKTLIQSLVDRGMAKMGEIQEQGGALGRGVGHLASEGLHSAENLARPGLEGATSFLRDKKAMLDRKAPKIGALLDQGLTKGHAIGDAILEGDKAIAHGAQRIFAQDVALAKGAGHALVEGDKAILSGAREVVTTGRLNGQPLPQAVMAGGQVGLRKGQEILHSVVDFEVGTARKGVAAVADFTSSNAKALRQAIDRGISKLTARKN